MISAKVLKAIKKELIFYQEAYVKAEKNVDRLCSENSSAYCINKESVEFTVNYERFYALLGLLLEFGYDFVDKEIVKCKKREGNND